MWFAFLVNGIFVWSVEWWFGMINETADEKKRRSGVATALLSG